MTRQKRKYWISILAAIFLAFSLTSLIDAVFTSPSFKKTTGTVVDVDVGEYKDSDDVTQYKSEIKYSYEVKGEKYTGRYTSRGDLSSMKGQQIDVLYDKDRPYKSKSYSVQADGELASGLGVIISLCYIVYDIYEWVKIRQKENEATPTEFSDEEKLAVEKERKKQKRTIIIFAVLSVVGLFILTLDIPFIVILTARIIDYNMCFKYKKRPSYASAEHSESC